MQLTLACLDMRCTCTDYSFTLSNGSPSLVLRLSAPRGAESLGTRLWLTLLAHELWEYCDSKVEGWFYNNYKTSCCTVSIYHMWYLTNDVINYFSIFFWIHPSRTHTDTLIIN